MARTVVPNPLLSGSWLRILIAASAWGLFAISLVPASAADGQSPLSGSLSTNLNRLADVTDLDNIELGKGRVTPVPGSAEANLGSDLPVPLGPASVAPGGKPSDNKTGEWIVAPIPFLNPTFGWGIGLGAGYIYQPLSEQSNAPPWITGMGGFYTQNESWGIGGAHKMNFGDDRWRLLTGGGYADLRYDFYGIGSDAGNAGRSVALNQRAGGGLFELLHQVTGHWYAGLRYMLANSQTRLDSASTNVPPSLALDPDELSANIAALGLHLQRDSRDSQFYPTRGSLLDFQAQFFDDAFGSDFIFQAYELSYNQYFSLATNHVLALRGYGRATSGRVPFFALCSFGAKGDLRGYTPGRYRDKVMFAVQSEYRWRLTQRFGVVAFAGLGGVAPEIDQFDTLLPSGGVGARYVIAKKNNVSLRFDAAWAKTSTPSTSASAKPFKVGQASRLSSVLHRPPPWAANFPPGTRRRALRTSNSITWRRITRSRRRRV